MFFSLLKLVDRIFKDIFPKCLNFTVGNTDKKTTKNVLAAFLIYLFLYNHISAFQVFVFKYN